MTRTDFFQRSSEDPLCAGRHDNSSAFLLDSEKFAWVSAMFDVVLRSPHPMRNKRIDAFRLRSVSTGVDGSRKTGATVTPVRSGEFRESFARGDETTRRVIRIQLAISRNRSVNRVRTETKLSDQRKFGGTVGPGRVSRRVPLEGRRAPAGVDADKIEFLQSAWGGGERRRAETSENVVVVAERTKTTGKRRSGETPPPHVRVYRERLSGR